jgi:hypothetical protein
VILNGLRKEKMCPKEKGGKEKEEVTRFISIDK